MAADLPRPAAPELDLDAVTTVVYGVPKVARGLGFDDKPTDQVKADQKDFFQLLYNLLVDADRGPRLPTLIVALGPTTVRTCSAALTIGPPRCGAGAAGDTPRRSSGPTPLNTSGCPANQRTPR